MLIFPEGCEDNSYSRSSWFNAYQSGLIKAVDPVPVNIHCIGRDRPYAVTLITAEGHQLAKTYEKNFGGYSKLDGVGLTSPVQFLEVEPQSLEEMAYVLSRITYFRSTAMIRARHGGKEGALLWDMCLPQQRRWKANGGPLVDKKSYWLFVDIDEFQIPNGFGYGDVPKLVGHLIECHLPEPFLSKSCVWWLSNSAGLTDKNLLKIHLVFKARMPISCVDYMGAMRLRQFRMFDRACSRGVQVFYTAAPKIIGADDPFKPSRDGKVRRGGIHHGTEGECVDLSVELRDGQIQSRQDAAYRAQATKRLAKLYDEPEPTDPFERLAWEMARDYWSDWERISRSNMGANKDGYYNPIFSLICAAVRKGETQMEWLKYQIRDFVRDFAKGRDNHKHGDIEDYLSDRSLDNQITSALKTLGVDQINHWGELVETKDV